MHRGLQSRWQTAAVDPRVWGSSGKAQQGSFRRRLDRWNTRTLPGSRVQRVERVLDAIASAVNPRVISAYIRLICNGWITARRFQRRSLCSFACGAREDSIEHYAKCSAVMSYFRIFLGLQRPDVGLELDHIHIYIYRPLSNSAPIKHQFMTSWPQNQ